MSVFYDDLLGLDEVHSEFLTHKLPHNEHYELLGIVDSTLHNEVLNLILMELPKNKHEYFLVEFKKDPSNKAHLDFIKGHSPLIEKKIKQLAKEVKAQALATIKQGKK